MPLPALRQPAQPDLAPRPELAPQPKDTGGRGQIHVAEDASTAAPSPARALQARLEQDLRGEPQEQAAEGRWPLYIALPFWGGVSAMLWAGIIGGAWLVLRHI
jgi:hypothetical protein